MYIYKFSDSDDFHLVKKVTKGKDIHVKVIRTNGIYRAGNEYGINYHWIVHNCEGMTEDEVLKEFPEYFI
jgi:hypothetical protein